LSPAPDDDGDGDGSPDARPPSSSLFTLRFTLPFDYPQSSPPLVDIDGPLDGPADPLARAMRVALDEAVAREAADCGGAGGYIYQVIEAMREWCDAGFGTIAKDVFDKWATVYCKARSTASAPRWSTVAGKCSAPSILAGSRSTAPAADSRASSPPS
jgi:hypothetical protein